MARAEISYKGVCLYRLCSLLDRLHLYIQLPPNYYFESLYDRVCNIFIKYVLHVRQSERTGERREWG